MLDAIILAGEKKVGPEGIPKALMRIMGKELISHQIDYLKDKVSKIIVSTGSNDTAKKIENFIYDAHPELAIICISEARPLGTAGAIKNCIDATESERVLIVNCDDLCDINIGELQKIPKDVICVQSPKLPFGIIKKNAIEVSRLFGKYSFLEKPILKGVYTSCGWYLLQRKVIQSFPNIGSVEYHVFPKINFNVYKHLGTWKTFNSQKDVEIYEMTKGLTEKTLFQS